MSPRCRMGAVLLAISLHAVACNKPCRPGTVFLTLDFRGDAQQAQGVELQVMADRDGLPTPLGVGRFGLNGTHATVEIDVDGYHATDALSLVGVASSLAGRRWVSSVPIVLAPQCTRAAISFDDTKGALESLAGPLGGGGAVDGSLSEARFFRPRALAFDSEDNLYVSEAAHTIRRITPSGRVSTIAGRAFVSGTDDGDGDKSRFDSPAGMDVDANGILWLTDEGNHTIRKIDLATQNVLTVAGLPRVPGLGDTGGFLPFFSSPTAIVYYSDVVGHIVLDTGNDALRVIRPAGDIVTINKFAPMPPLDERPPVPGYANGVVFDALFREPRAIARGLGGEVFIADTGNHAIRRIDPSFLVSTYAGPAQTAVSPQSGFVDGPAAQARFRRPSGVAVAPDGTVFVADTLNHAIRAIALSGDVTTIAGALPTTDGSSVSIGQFGYADGQGAVARFRSPMGLALSRSGDLFVADSSNHAIRKIVRSGGNTQVTTYTGSAPLSGLMDGAASEARFALLRGLCAGADKLFVADELNYTLRMIDLSSNQVSSLGEQTFAYSCGTDGSRVWYSPKLGGLIEIDVASRTRRTIYPEGTGILIGFAFDAAREQLYLSDTRQHHIRRMDLATGTMQTVAGKPGEQGSTDGSVDLARFSGPVGLALDETRQVLYVSEVGGHAIRAITLGTTPNTVSTIAGNRAGFGYVDGVGPEVRFKGPSWISFDGAHSLFVSDAGNRAIRRIDTRTLAVDTIVGAGAAGLVRLGDLAQASLALPAGIVALPSGGIAIADADAYTILKIVLSP